MRALAGPFAPLRGARGRIALALALVAIAGIATIAALSGGGSSRARTLATARAPSNVASATGQTGVAGARAPVQEGATAAVGGSRRTVGEVRDPEEASSFPAPAGAVHSAAASPAKAREAFLAQGAQTLEEVKKELSQVESIKRAAEQQQHELSKPVPGGESIGGNGTIKIPTGVPEAVRAVIAGANEIADFPYVYGGGHASFIDNAYDCSGSVSYALAAGGLLSRPETSGELESWGVPGPGRYITVLANAGHTYMYVDGILYDTAGRSGVYASRWQVQPTNNAGYVVRHWPGL
jgi:cell wall-associated NlpC family hydrolase